MTGLGFVLAAAVGGLTAFCAVALPTRPLGPLGRNYRGALLYMALGPALIAGVMMIVLTDVLVDAVQGRVGDAWRPAAVILGLFIVFGFGFLDDYRTGPSRGLAGHFKQLLHGRITTGMGKLGAAVFASFLVAAALGSEGLRLILAIPFIAGTTNLWNLLDVRPGRALKYFIVVLGIVALIDWRFAFHLYLIPAALGASIALLSLDVRERAMLGDSGSNLLGFVVGIASFRLIPTWGLGVSLVFVLLFHVAAETVTLSRLIEATPPLRWFDRLGRLPVQQAKPVESADPRDSAAT
jgi:UDP-GlcNAc:undecaprenyl-phosphate/decaprenyl-phosphate GlcNAc-1-phosphate transferase